MPWVAEWAAEWAKAVAGMEAVEPLLMAPPTTLAPVIAARTAAVGAAAFGSSRCFPACGSCSTKSRRRMGVGAARSCVAWAGYAATPSHLSSRALRICSCRYSRSSATRTRPRALRARRASRGSSRTHPLSAP